MSLILSSSASITFISEESGLSGLSSDRIEAFDCVFITAELIWDGYSPIDYRGIDIAVELRLGRMLLAPICILSFTPKKYFYTLPDIKFNILKARGTAFCQIPATSESLELAVGNVMPLSRATLAYLSNLLVDVKHLIDHLRHSLRMSATHDIIASSVRRLDILSSSGIYQPLCSIAAGILAAHENGDEELFYKNTGDILDILGTYWQQTGGTSVNEEGSRHTLLVVDDNPDDLKWATSALQHYFKVIGCKSAIDARRMVDEDSGNEIAAIICDWQLLKPESGEHQEMLGFELLEYAARKGHYALFSLTSTDDTSTLEVDQYLWFEHTLITKDFRHDEALWRMYIPIIRQKIEHTRAIIASLPTGEGWTTNFKLAYRKENGRNVAYRQYYTSLKDQYTISRNSEDWHNFESEISAFSSKLWEYYRNGMIDGERPFIFDLKSQWGIELNRDLKNVLIIRRLFLAFWFNKTKLDISFRVPDKGVVEDPVINIYSVLRHRYFDDVLAEKEGYGPQKAYKDLNNAAKVFASQLAIEPNKLPQGVLPEEKAWLASLGIQTESGNDNLYYTD